MQYLLIISHDEFFAPTETLLKDIGARRSSRTIERNFVREYESWSEMLKIDAYG